MNSPLRQQPPSFDQKLRDHAGWVLEEGKSRFCELTAYFRFFNPTTTYTTIRARLMGVLFLTAALFLVYMFGGGQAFASPRMNLIPNAPGSFELQKSWAQYSPYFNAGNYEDPPKGCRVVQANLIQRHGARFPTSGATTGIEAALSKLQSAKVFTDPRLAFLENYTYDLGQDDLVPVGAQEAHDAGKVHFSRYSDIISSKNLPFVRASGSERVVFSASNWTAGFSIASHHVYNPKVSVVISEDLNNTLDDSMCPNAGNSDAQTSQWLSEYGPPIAARLNEQAPGANLTPADVFSLMTLCPFETVAKNSLSPFCAVFTPAEFQQFEYSGDLDKYYNTGYGQPLGRVQGVGYINELLARLTGKPVQDHTQTNRTLDASPTTFPLNRTLYADFSHDNQMIAIYAALGLFPQTTPPDPARPDPARSWLAARLVPFSARLVTEKLACGARGREFVRVFVNDARQPLEFCGAGEDGLCELGAFVASQAYARSDGSGDFEKCFE